MSRKSTCCTSGVGGGAGGSEGSRAMAGDVGGDFGFFLDMRSAPFVLGTVHGALLDPRGKRAAAKAARSAPAGLPCGRPPLGYKAGRQGRSQGREERVWRPVKPWGCNGLGDGSWLVRARGQVPHRSPDPLGIGEAGEDVPPGQSPGVLVIASMP